MILTVNTSDGRFWNTASWSFETFLGIFNDTFMSCIGLINQALHKANKKALQMNKITYQGPHL